MKDSEFKRTDSLLAEGYYQMKADIYEVCGCSDLKWLNYEFFDD